MQIDVGLVDFRQRGAYIRPRYATNLKCAWTAVLKVKKWESYFFSSSFIPLCSHSVSVATRPPETIILLLLLAKQWRVFPIYASSGRSRKTFVLDFRYFFGCGLVVLPQYLQWMWLMDAVLTRLYVRWPGITNTKEREACVLASEPKVRTTDWTSSAVLHLYMDLSQPSLKQASLPH